MKVTVEGDAEMVFSEAAGRVKDKLTLGPNGYAFLAEGAARLTVQFRGRLKQHSRT